MPQSPDPHDETLRRLDERLGRIEASRAARKPRFDVEGGAGDGYRLLAELIGGVLGGLGFGWLFDQFAGTEPWGLIGGVLIGTMASVYLVVRSAGRMSARAPAAGAVRPAPAADDDDDESPGIFGPKDGD